MLSQDLNNLRQTKLNALSAIFLHKRRIEYYRRRNLLVEFLTLAVPALYIILRFVLKGGAIERPVEIIWEILAGVLLALAIFKVVYKWQSLENEHTVMMTRNEDIKNEADQLLVDNTVNSATLIQFLKRASEVGIKDDHLFLHISEKERQEAYREGLKRLNPGVVERCAKCNADPWDSQQGSCDMCGGEPAPPENTALVS